MVNWKKEGNRVHPDGVDVYYTNSERPNIRIESRKRHIPRSAGRPATWQRTRFFVIVEKATFSGAKELAELIAEKS